MRDFAAIDFETANECPSSVCSVGVVIVRDGEVTDSFYSLIHPEPEYYKWFCQEVHGLGPEDLEEAASAYKDIDEVMANQSDLTKIVTTLEPIAVIKGARRNVPEVEECA